MTFLCLISLSCRNVFQGCVCVGACGYSFCPAEQHPTVQGHFCSPVYQLVSPKWYFHLFALMSNAAMNVPVQLSLVCRYKYFQFFQIYISRSGVAGSWTGSIFNFWRNHQTVSQINSPVQIKSCLSSCFPLSRWLLAYSTSGNAFSSLPELHLPHRSQILKQRLLYLNRGVIFILTLLLSY